MLHQIIENMQVLKVAS